MRTRLMRWAAAMPPVPAKPMRTGIDFGGFYPYPPPRDRPSALLRLRRAHSLAFSLREGRRGKYLYLGLRPKPYEGLRPFEPQQGLRPKPATRVAGTMGLRPLQPGRLRHLPRSLRGF